MIDPESIPCWLSTLKQGDRFPRRDFFRSRILFYPGSGLDHSPVMRFVNSSAVHCFVSCDYCINESDFEQVKALDGHRMVESRPLQWKEVCGGRSASYPENEDPVEFYRDRHDHPSPFALWRIYDRVTECSGAERWCILHICHDAFAVFRALFCRPSRRLPYAMALFDFNYVNTRFGGKESPLWAIIKESGRRPPEWIMTDSEDAVWPGYHVVENGLGTNREEYLSRRGF